MMIRIVLCVILSLTAGTSFSQSKITDDDAPGVKYVCLYGSLKKRSNNSSIQLPFNSIEVIDSRSDTSKIGFFRNRSAEKMMRLCFKSGAQNEIGGFCNNYLSSNFAGQSKRLVVNLRKLWIGTYDSLIIKGKKPKHLLNLTCKIEFYLKEGDCYYPLYRFDNYMVLNTALSEEIFDSVGDILISSFERIFENYQFDTKRMRCLSQNTFDSFNTVRIKYPVITSGITAKGVFLNFNEFRNNIPTYQEFELKLGKQTDEIYVKGKTGIDSLITDAWGLCDGERLFMRIGYNYFPLFKCGYNFDLYGSADLIISRPFYNIDGINPLMQKNYITQNAQGLISAGVAEMLSWIKTTSLKLKPYQLDMETGQLY